MKSYIRNWNVMRWIRLIAGIYVVVLGFQSGERLFVILGGVFALMPLLNIGCNSTRSCNMTSHRNFKKKKAPFEEID